MNILHIDSSIHGADSVSRALSAALIDRHLAIDPGSTIIYHDLGADGVGHLTGAHLAAFQGGVVTDTMLGADLAKGGAYIDELFAADMIVIGAPMYNFTVSTQLKAWIDRLLVAGRTFRYGPNGPEGIVPSNKKVFVISTRGGIHTAPSPTAFLEHHESYLRGVLGFIGLTDLTVIRAEGLSMGPEVRTTALAAAQGEIAALAA